MKNLPILFLLLFIILMSAELRAQDEFAGMNGKIFKCRFTEQTPPDVDRMPKFFEDDVKFENGRLSCTYLKNYSPEDFPFTAAVDERRAVAFTVVQFSALGNGNAGAIPVQVSFSGDVVGYVGLSGELIIAGQGFEEKFIVETINP